MALEQAEEQGEETLADADAERDAEDDGEEQEKEVHEKGARPFGMLGGRGPEADFSFDALSRSTSGG